MPDEPQSQTRLFTLTGGQFGQTGFDIALRGYDRAQVDGYVARVEHAMAALVARADAAERRIADLAEALNAANADRLRLRAERSPAPEVRLGARLEQIMRLAEEQAEEIEAAARDRAREIVADAEREADRLRAGVRAELATLADRRRETRAALSRVNGEVARLAALAESAAEPAPTDPAPVEAAAPPPGQPPAQPDRVAAQPDQAPAQPDRAPAQPDRVPAQPDRVAAQPDRVVTQRIVIGDVPTQRIGMHDKAVEHEPADEPTRTLAPVPVLPHKRRKRRARR